MGDFYMILHPDEKFGGGKEKDSAITDAKNLFNLNIIGEEFTWNNMRVEEYLIQTKLDKAVCSSS